MWEAINQHVALATATNSPILHVLIAEKVVTSLTDVFNNIITYVQTLDTSTDPELQGIELEYISALANDTALHIEEVIELIDTFTISEIRERIDEIFDPLTTLLVQCGQVCVCVRCCFSFFFVVFNFYVSVLHGMRVFIVDISSTHDQY